MAKYVQCKSCGEAIEKGTKICPHCGAKRKSALPGIIALVIGLSLIAWGLDSAGLLSTGDKATGKTTSAPSTEQTQPVDIKTPGDETTAPADESTQLPLDTVMALIEGVTAKNFGKDNYKMEYDETSVTISVWADGVAVGAAYAANGDKECLESWETLTKSTVDNCTSIVDSLNTAGYDDMIVTFNVLNDQNTENVLLMIVNGAVLYDAVKAK